MLRGCFSVIGSVEKYLLDKIEKENTLHITLIDPENITSKQASIVAKTSSRSGTSAIMIGGSTSISKNHLNSIVKSIKQTVELPLILNTILRTKCKPCASNIMRHHKPEMEFTRAPQFVTRCICL